MYNYMYNWRFFIILEIELPKASEDKVYRLFLDPTGKHLIICMESTENLYLSRNSRKPRSIGKLKVGVQCTGSLAISEGVKPNSCMQYKNNISVPNYLICTRLSFLYNGYCLKKQTKLLKLGLNFMSVFFFFCRVILWMQLHGICKTQMRTQQEPFYLEPVEVCTCVWYLVCKCECLMSLTYMYVFYEGQLVLTSVQLKF